MSHEPMNWPKSCSSLGVRAGGPGDVQGLGEAIGGHRRSSGRDEQARAAALDSLDCRWGGTGLVADPVFKTGRAS